MKKLSKEALKKGVEILITILTALCTVLGAQACGLA